MSEKSKFVKTTLAVSLITATLVTLMFVALASVWPEDQLDVATGEGVKAIACMLQFPPAGSPGGRTPGDVEECMEDYLRVIDEQGAE